jgi:anti-sigma28 factor (negative regulator of flagellin synthesis)
MRVDDPNLTGAAGAQTNRTPETQETNRAGSPANQRISESSGGDRAEISSLAGRISQAFAANAAARTQRIAKLTQDYRAGNYHVDARSIAQAVTGDAIERKTDGSR